ncbi:uncharacterized protein LOC119674867 [Teleopsis dalmanni]|uniref:uncharacterized protein LOC119674867 n=1 Tax=Teleopsis dalmanni TaxID=139649 RepID=UPI0018CD0305|nr:uncharacterized protein LOC119674867 [Teleopsis dalmanni]
MRCNVLNTLESPSTAGVALDVTVVDLLSDCAAYINRQNSSGSNCSEEKKQNKYRNIAEKPETNNCLQIAPTSIQLIQPQLITLSFPNDSESITQSKQTINAIPVQTVKPFILPKPATATVAKHHNTSTANSAVTTNHITINSPSINNEPSSASLTPTSQLPIKERLKAILNQNNRRSIEIPIKTNNRQRTIAGKAHYKFDEDCMERRRAAATRYRVKMRNEHKDLRRKNIELQAENEKLRNRVSQLEQILSKQQTIGAQLSTDGTNKSAISLIKSEFEIPSSTIKLVMKIPKMVVTPNGPPLFQNPITYSIEKK